MEETTIITDCEAARKAIEALGFKRILVINPLSLSLTCSKQDTNYIPEFGPEPGGKFKTLSGNVICAIRPGLENASVLTYVLHCLKDAPVNVRYAPLHGLAPEHVERALQTAGADPKNRLAFLVTSDIGWRITRAMLLSHITSRLGKDEARPPRGLLYAWYLFLGRIISNTYWTVHLDFGKCRATEVDRFGGTTYYTRRPGLVSWDFTVEQKEHKDKEFPDPRLQINQMLERLPEPYPEIGPLFRALNDGYEKGLSTWPFIYGSTDFFEEPIRTLPGYHGPLQHIPQRQPAIKRIRIYKPKDSAAPHGKTLFRSVSYYTPQGQPLDNPIPDEVKQSEVGIKTEQHEPSGNTLKDFATYLTGLQMNLNIEVLAKLVLSDYFEQDGTFIGLTDKGRQATINLQKLGLTEHRLYLMIRFLEGIYLDRADYEKVLQRIQETLSL